MSYKINIPKPIMIDKIDIARLKKMFYNNDIHYDSITTNGYMTTIITNAIPKAIFNLIKTKFTTINYTKEDTICQK
jgi:hypothetical protein